MLPGLPVFGARNACLSPRGGVFFASARSVAESVHMEASSVPCGWRGSEAVDVIRRQFVGRRLKDCPVVVDLHELSPVCRRAKGRRDGRWFERFAEMCQGLSSHGTTVWTPMRRACIRGRKA